jgi:hypothetical protein
LDRNSQLISFSDCACAAVDRLLLGAGGALEAAKTMTNDNDSDNDKLWAEDKVRNILGAIDMEMHTDDDQLRQSYKFIAWVDDLSAEQKQLVDEVLLQICGWSFATLIEKSEVVEL